MLMLLCCPRTVFSVKSQQGIDRSEEEGSPRLQCDDKINETGAKITARQKMNHPNNWLRIGCFSLSFYPCK